MGKKGAYTGESPADRSINLIDKFIKRSEKKNAHKDRLPARRKAKDVPIDLWPLKDQLEYWDNMSDEDKFDHEYKNFHDWFDSLKELVNYPAISIRDMVSGNMDVIKEKFNLKTKPKTAYRELQKEGILWR
tara:strand:+ start:87 stop:479 length:393 start_codon:yes stop_codon:yes gene_type:complete